MQSYFLAVNMVEGEGKNRVLPIDVGKQFILEKGILCDKCARLFFLVAILLFANGTHPIQLNVIK